MYNYIYKHDLILQGLEIRLKRCSDAKELVDKSMPSFIIERKVQFNKEIAFLFHYMISEPSVKYIIDSIYLIGEKINKIEEYNLSKTRSKEHIIDIIKHLRKRKDYRRFIALKKSYFRFYMLRPSPRTAPDVFTEIIKIPPKAIDSSLLEKTIATLRAITSEWIRFNDKDWNQYFIKIEECEQFKRNLQFYDLFSVEYSSRAQLEHLLLVYKSFNPNYDYTKLRADELTLTKLLSEGDSDHFLPADQLYNDAKAIVEYVRMNLSTAKSIQYLIEQFAIYMSLYNIDSDIRKEKDIQLKFEEFSFLRGYYPLSEIQFRKARIDDLLQNKDSSFLFEIKLIRISDRESEIRKLFKKSLFQAKKYFEFLKILPGLRPEVNILIFTQRAIINLSTTNVIVFHGVSYIYHIIELTEEAASKIKPVEIVIE